MRPRWSFFDCQWVLLYKRFYTKKYFLLFIRKLRALLVFSCAALLTDGVFSFHFAAFHTKSIFLRAVETKIKAKKLNNNHIQDILYSSSALCTERYSRELLENAGLPTCSASSFSINISTVVFYFLLLIAAQVDWFLFYRRDIASGASFLTARVFVAHYIMYRIKDILT